MPEFPTVQEFIASIKLHAGAYAKYALAARLSYINIRQKQDREIRALYIRSANKLAEEIKKGGSLSRIGVMVQIEQALRNAAEEIGTTLGDLMRGYIEEGAEAGTGYTRSVLLSYTSKTGIAKAPIDAMIYRVNTAAVEAIYARTYQDGLKVSDRIWKAANNARDAMKEIVLDGVATGEDAVSVARKLEQYVKEGKSSMAEDYPNMMKRMGSRVPKDISYEALRLARTEMTSAYGEGTILSSRETPSYLGMKWALSSSHPEYDVCDVLATAEFGQGPGVYPPGEEPKYPAHANCLCTLIPIHEDPDDVVEKLLAWEADPSSQPEIEQWYQGLEK